MVDFLTDIYSLLTKMCAAMGHTLGPFHMKPMLSFFKYVIDFGLKKVGIGPKAKKFYEP